VILENLRLLDFRNFQDVEIETGGDSAVIWGPNGRGKTNILEAIFILGTTRSHRTRKDIEMVRFGRRLFSVTGKFRREDRGTTALSVNYETNGKKRGRVDGKDVGRLSSMVGQCGVVLVSPEDVEITGGEPERRRQYIDLTLCSIDPVYLRSLQEYNRILRQRGRILRDTRDEGRARLLDPWDRQLAKSAFIITGLRAAAVRELTPLAEEAYGILGGGEKLSVGYRPGTGEEFIGSEEDILARLQSVRSDDLRMKRTTVGPHRDDLALELDGNRLRSFGSRGQHRTAVLALKLAAIGLMKERLGENPILLLDDVFTELDAERAAKLASFLEGAGQIFATGTERSELGKYFPAAARFAVREEGRVVRAG